MTLHRRKFMQALGLLAVVTPKISLGNNEYLTHSPQPTTPGFMTGPYIQNLNPDSITIQILTTTNSYTWIEYGIDGLQHNYFESKHGLKVANCRFFQFKIKNLKPNATYSYRIHTKPITKMSGYDVRYAEQITSDIYTFKTPPINSDSCQVVIYNDIHDRKESFELLWNHRKQSETDLVIFNGDIFNQITTEEQIINNFLTPINKLFSSQIPFVFNRGNHETRGLYARESIDYFDLPNGKTYHALKHGPVFWIFLDSGEDKPDTSKEYFGLADFDKLRIEQRDWLLSIVKSKDFKKAKYRAVVMHMPPLHSGDWHGPTHCTELFVPIFNANKIDIVYSGHTHNAKYFPPSNNNKFALFIGGAPQNGKRTILDIKADRKAMTTKLIADDGKVLHEYTIAR